VAAERSLHRRGPFDGIQGWTNWTIKVAWHEVQAEWRRQARLETGDLPERPDIGDPATLAEHRLDVEAMARALSGLKPADRAAALAGLDLDPEAEGPLSPSEKMRRYRARRRLAALIAASESFPKRAIDGRKKSSDSP
jgi:DNA-directed RNA polymerase specialized sigma24 family protein